MQDLPPELDAGKDQVLLGLLWIQPLEQEPGGLRGSGATLLLLRDWDELVKGMMGVRRWEGHGAAPGGTREGRGDSQNPGLSIPLPHHVQAPPGACGRAWGTRLGLSPGMRTEPVLG